jgi:hypothetical protein
MLHCTVPIKLAFETPEYPSILVGTSRGVSMKSLLLFVIDLLAPLSTNSSNESVSNDKAFGLSVDLVMVAL